MADRIVFYGKGGVGKSTLIANISAALAEVGFRVLQIGCDATADSCSMLNGGVPIPAVSHLCRHHGVNSRETSIRRGVRGVFCMELGARPLEGFDVSRSEMISLVSASGVIDSVHPDIVLFDVSGEASCEELHGTLLHAGITQVFGVTSADFSSLAAVNTIVQICERFGESHGSVPFGGLIINGTTSSFDDSFVADFARRIGTHTIGKIPRSLLVRQCELYGKTVVEASPMSNQTYFYRRLANQIVDETGRAAATRQPVSLAVEQLRSWAHEWADRLYTMENGLVADGAAI